PLEDEKVYQNEIPFKKGDRILLFTDGVIEAKNSGGDEYGDERLEAFFIENEDLQVGPFNQKLLNELNRFTGNDLKDDVFILSILTK
ncbi:PP2C family protein-serine/threonine phosphatase, partial [Candidatus Omnitrophota bacterium]